MNYNSYIYISHNHTNAKSRLKRILKKILKWIKELTFDKQNHFMKSLNFKHILWISFPLCRNLLRFSHELNIHGTDEIFALQSLLLTSSQIPIATESTRNKEKKKVNVPSFVLRKLLQTCRCSVRDELYSWGGS